MAAEIRACSCANDQRKLVILKSNSSVARLRWPSSERAASPSKCACGCPVRSAGRSLLPRGCLQAQLRLLRSYSKRF